MPISAATLACLAALTCGGCDRVFGLVSGDRTDAIDAPSEGPVPLDDALDGSAPVLAYDMAVLQDTPIAYFKLDETSPLLAKNEIMGMPAGKYFGPYVLGEPGPISSQPNTSVAFGDGSTTPSGIDFGDNYAFAGHAPFSIEAWIEFAVTPQNTPIVLAKRHDATDGSGWVVYCDQGSVAFRRYASDLDASFALATDPLGATRWRHIVATYDGATTAVYINGASGPASPSGQTLPVVNDNTRAVAGAISPSSSASLLTGHMDNIAIYDKALSAVRIAAHFGASQ